MSKQYIAITGERDERGRAPFTMFWSDPDAVFCPEPSKFDGQPVGHRRGQCFRANPDDYIARGAVLVASEAVARSLAWCASVNPAGKGTP